MDDETEISKAPSKWRGLRMLSDKPRSKREAKNEADPRRFFKVGKKKHGRHV